MVFDQFCCLFVVRTVSDQKQTDIIADVCGVSKDFQKKRLVFLRVESSDMADDKEAVQTVFPAYLPSEVILKAKLFC